jgi:thiamine pyrophosphate-dependent acetolactate synthase large subunit-like protein
LRNPWTAWLDGRERHGRNRRESDIPSNRLLRGHAQPMSCPVGISSPVRAVKAEPDFGAVARAMGCYGEGPIDRPDAIRPALLRALEHVKNGCPALVDV